MCAVVVRRLTPGSYDAFRAAWEPLKDDEWPAGMTRLWIGRAEDDPDVVATWGLFDLDEAGLDAMRDDPEWMAAENRRMERMARVRAGARDLGLLPCRRGGHPAGCTLVELTGRRSRTSGGTSRPMRWALRCSRSMLDGARAGIDITIIASDRGLPPRSQRRGSRIDPRRSPDRAPRRRGHDLGTTGAGRRCSPPKQARVGLLENEQRRHRGSARIRRSHHVAVGDDRCQCVTTRPGCRVEDDVVVMSSSAIHCATSAGRCQPAHARAARVSAARARVAARPRSCTSASISAGSWWTSGNASGSA